VSADSKYAAEYPENVEVKDYLCFNVVLGEPTMLEGVYVLRALALRLGLDEFYLTIMHKDGNSILTYSFTLQLHQSLKTIRAAHGDINLITLLMGAQGKGYKCKTTTENGLMPLQNQIIGY
jgi:isopenicillin N synthase-like dioxygenase